MKAQYGPARGYAEGYVSNLRFPGPIRPSSRIRPGYVSTVYPSRIGIGYVSDTRYGNRVAYRCYIAGHLKPDSVEGSDVEIPEFNVSYKPQKISPKYKGSVRMLLISRIRDSYMHPQFVSDVMKPLLIEQLMDEEVVNLSGGELQRVALTICLGKPADIYLIDEPSAFLDSEQRIVASKVIKRFILHAKKTAFVVEHDFIMATYLADRVIVYEGKPSIDCVANSPQSLLTGMNLFLSHLDITFRRDPTNFRPRINKLESTKDREQKSAGSYYYLDD
ncbi:hypothetical protein SASPL_143188 [Salvia splendens]|uniref:ABC transporter domain-containing protein n=1 Tax=Salvia splendens TaxID=180675 RepID=A0A8X8WLC0_SALSN|nr:hypothetical protein SASPL_143188 [Salvia splendens]